MTYNPYFHNRDLRSRTYLYYTDNQDHEQPTTRLPSERSPERSSEDDSTYSPTSNSIYSRSLDSLSSEPSPTSSLIDEDEVVFLGWDQARGVREAFGPGSFPGVFSLTEHELRGMDAEIYGHLDPAVHGLTFSRQELRQIFDEARTLWSSRTASPISSVSPQRFPLNNSRIVEARDRIIEAWEQLNRSPELSSYQEFFGQSVDAPQEPDVPWREINDIDADRMNLQ